MAFSIALFTFEFLAKTDIFLPEYSGSTFRGGFGTAFKKAVCIFRSGKCEECPYRDNCAYLYVFETPVQEQIEPLNLSGYAPHPFVLEPDLNTTSTIKDGNQFSLNLILFGKGLEYLPFFIFTFIRLGKIGIGKGQGKFEIKAVYSLNGRKTKIYSPNSDKLKRTYHSLYWYGIDNEPDQDESQKEIKIIFKTPTRIKSQGKYLQTIQFDLLITNLLRRIRFIDSVHGDGKIEYNHEKWIDQAKQVEIADNKLFWNDWKRYSRRQKEKIFMGGVQGEITYKGPITQFMELLEIGSKLHVGKGTAFGMGKFDIA